MSWNNGGPSPWGSPGGSSGSGNGNRRPGGPWGQGGGGDRPGGRPGGPGGPLPEIDRLIAQLQASARRILGGPGGRFTSGRGLGLIGLGVVALWLLTGFYRVQPDELGVVLRFGAYSYQTQPGLHWHLPWPIEHVERPAVTRINRIEIGYRSATPGQGRQAAARFVPAESLMLTGDENIVDIDVAVFWRIRNAAAYLFNTQNPEGLVRGVTESSMREVIGHTPIQTALTQGRAQIEQSVMHQSQQILDRYKAGVEITQVQLQKVDPPAAVVESFRDVQRANTDAERMRNEAEAYRNDIVPRARGDAARVVAEAQGAKQASVAEATGQAQRFDSVLAAYRAAKDVTLQRMYLDTMSDVLTHSHPLVVDDRLKSIVPYLQLNPPPPPSATTPKPAPSSAPEESAVSSNSGGSR